MPVTIVVTDSGDDPFTEIGRKLDLVLEKLGELMTSQENLQTQVDELNAAVDTIGAGVSTLKANLTAATDEITRLQQANPNIDLSSLTAAVDGAQAIAEQFIIPAVDPGQDTPAVADVPAPVEGAPEPEPVPTPSGETASSADAPASDTTAGPVNPY